MFDLQPNSRLSGLVAGLLMVAALASPLVVTSNNGRHLIILICVYGALAQAWNILAGFAGQISLGNAFFFGLGAYTSSYLLTAHGVTPWLGGLIGIGVAVVFALIIGYPVFRLGGHYFAIATIAIGEIALVIANNLDLIGGATGISLPLVRDPATRRPIDSWLMLQFNSSKLPYVYLALALFGLITLVALLTERSRLGYYLRAIKNDQIAAAALGVPVTRYKLIAIAISAGATALVGTFYAQYLLFIDPETTLSLSLSILIALVAILGGAGNVWGPLLGAVVLIPLAEYTRTQLGGSGRALDLVIYGLLIMLIAVFQPSGLSGLPQRFRQWRTRRTTAPRQLRPATGQRGEG